MGLHIPTKLWCWCLVNRLRPLIGWKRPWRRENLDAGSLRIQWVLVYRGLLRRDTGAGNYLAYRALRLLAQ